MVGRAFTTLIPEILPSVPGCPQPLALQHIRRASIRACEQTLMWRYVQPKYNLIPGVHTYAFDKPTNTEVQAIFGAVVNDYPLETMTLDQAIIAYPEWVDLFSGVDPATVWSGVPSGAFNTGQFNGLVFNNQATLAISAAAVEEGSTPRTICQVTPDTYTILPLPDNTVTYTMRVFYALKPSRDATGMDSAAMDELHEVICHNALQQLLVMPNVAWGDRELATYHARQALFHTTERRARANMGNTRSPMLVRFPHIA